MSRDGRGLRRLALGWLVLGMLGLAAGALLLAGAWWFTANSVGTGGVVRLHEQREGGVRDLAGRYVHSNVVPVVEFHDAHGVVHRVHGQLPRLETRVPPPGAGVQVRYHRLQDGRVSARIDQPLEIWGIPGFITAFGALMFCGGLIARRAARGGRPPDRWRRPRAEDWTRMLQRRR